MNNMDSVTAPLTDDNYDIDNETCTTYVVGPASLGRTIFFSNDF